jgi:hypothetical protein
MPREASIPGRRLPCGQDLDNPPAYKRFLPASRAGDDPTVRHAPFLRSKDLGMFAGSEDELLGRRAGADLALRAEPGGCEGAVEQARQLGGVQGTGWTVSGWARDRAGSEGPERVLVTDERRKVVGMSTPIVRDLLPQGGGSRDRVRWLAYSILPASNRWVEIWALQRGDTLCRLAGPLRLGDGEEGQSPRARLNSSTHKTAFGHGRQELVEEVTKLAFNHEVACCHRRHSNGT